MKVILYQPQIPQNTGNIVRTCSVTGCELLLVEPLGYSLSSRHLKRAGLDYWEGVSVEKCRDLESYLDQTEAPFYFLSSHAEKSFTEVEYTPDTMLIFGSETEGLPDLYREKWPDKFIRIPMIRGARCLNLATSVGIAVYEGVKKLELLLN